MARMPAWARLVRQRHFPNMSSSAPFPGPVNSPTGLLQPSDFDPFIGHCSAVVDTVASVFAADLIRAYPNAKIISNTRKNADRWQRSLNDSILASLVRPCFSSKIADRQDLAIRRMYPID